jgi:hypothetical protein
MNVEEFYVPDDDLDEASAAKYQMVLTIPEGIHTFFFIKSNFSYA